ncbi:MAG: pseudaminic acid biosynthesis-associated methylase [Candidatus Anammoxibacter sp.]
MNRFKTAQEKFWVGKFGDDYSDRNTGDSQFSSNIALFSKILSNTKNVKSVIEFGANTGLNLKAIRNLLPASELAAVEINKYAANKLQAIDGIKIYNQSILEFTPENKYDLSLIKGVLIHINPDSLSSVYDLLYNTSKKYICVCEYYNPTPVSINYRGHEDRLFKRDFAGELMDKFPDLDLVDYGFVYHRDPNFPQDDCTWFLLEKK